MTDILDELFGKKLHLIINIKPGDDPVAVAREIRDALAALRASGQLGEPSDSEREVARFAQLDAESFAARVHRLQLKVEEHFSEIGNRVAEPVGLAGGVQADPPVVQARDQGHRPCCNQPTVHNDSSTAQGRPESVLRITVEVRRRGGGDSRPCASCGGAA